MIDLVGEGLEGTAAAGALVMIFDDVFGALSHGGSGFFEGFFLGQLGLLGFPFRRGTLTFG